jgi:hypothetical protein
MHARGMSVREIQAHLQSCTGCRCCPS